MDAELRTIALRIANSVWRRVQASHQRSFDADDLRQEAMVSAWLWWSDHPDCMDTDHGRALAATVIRRDVIDAMRHLQPVGRKREDGVPVYRALPRSLDEPVRFRAQDGSPTTLGDTLPDESADDALEAVERAHDVHLAFAQHRGPAGDPAERATPAVVAWLNLHGVALADIGTHYGFTESRASQLRTAFITATAARWAAAEREADRSAA